ncbi:MAG: ArsR/SmtB family transcription factor, partial [Candidatus Izemoplasmataceae bacterium]|jgi:DNA-binding transcriptional ArsR family regulator|uniref:ArsR/SmtB family transcription factor n=1 Tax=Liberiplasma polymorphum TaxID=3374570 RepID=UPI0037758233
MKKIDQIKDTVKLFKIFSDETRLRIIALLSESEYCVQEISDTLKMSQSSISHQLKLLRDLNVVKTRREGKNIFYSLKDEHIKEIYLIGYAHANEC